MSSSTGNSPASEGRPISSGFGGGAGRNRPDEQHPADSTFSSTALNFPISKTLDETAERAVADGGGKEAVAIAMAMGSEVSRSFNFDFSSPFCASVSVSRVGR